MAFIRIMVDLYSFCNFMLSIFNVQSDNLILNHQEPELTHNNADLTILVYALPKLNKFI